LGLFDWDNQQWEPFGEEVDADRSGTIINDGLVWEDNLIFGTKDLEFAHRKAGLYLYRGRDQKLVRLRDDQICSNGKAVRLVDGGPQLVDIDSPTRQVVGYPLDIDGGRLGEPQVLLDLTDGTAVPDGATLGPGGDSIIISMYNPNPAEFGETRQYALEDGGLQRVWRTPASPQNTCPNLISHQGRVHLVITTAVEHMPEERRAAANNAGCLFIADTPFDELAACPKFPA
jgi:sugar lactone lactonase YvrE